MKWMLLYSMAYIASVDSWCHVRSENGMWWGKRATYPATAEPIDVVIVAHKKDLLTLDKAITGIKTYGQHIRAVYVVSETKLTDAAEWFDEARFPFTKKALALEIFSGDNEKADVYLAAPHCRIGWIYQQILKLYAPFIIPGISSNVLILDADTIFLRPVSFMDAEGNAFFTPGIGEHYGGYFRHGKKLLTRFVRAANSGIAHHMLFQRALLEHFFAVIRAIHGVEPWKACMRCVDHHELQRSVSSVMSEYELYFHFAVTTLKLPRVRALRWMDMRLNEAAIEQARKDGYHYVSCHSYMQDA